MARTFLPPDPVALYPGHHPDLRDLSAFRENRLTLEWLSKMHLAIHSAEVRLSDASDQESLTMKRGIIKGLRDSLNILETIATEITTSDREISESPED
jgi:hypothetical protein